MAVSYNKLWKKLIDLEMSRTELRLKAGFSTKVLAKLGKNESVEVGVLVKICSTLNCEITDINIKFINFSRITRSFFFFILSEILFYLFFIKRLN